MITKKGLIWSGIDVWTGNFFQICIFAILSKLVPPSEIGLFAFANIFFTFFRSVLGLSFFDTIIFYKLDKREQSAFFWFLFFLFSLATIACLLIGFYFEHFHFYKGLFLFLALMSINFFTFLCGAVSQAECLANLDFDKLAFRRIADSLLGGVAGISACFLHFGVFSFFIQTLVGSLVSTFLLQIYKPFVPSFIFSLPKNVYSFYIKRIAGTLISFGNQKTDLFLVGLFLGQSNLGIYSLVNRIFSFANVLSNEALNKYGLSYISRVSQIHNSEKNILFLLNLNLYLSGWIFSSVYIFSPSLFHYFFGFQWMECIPVLQIFCIYGFLASISSSFLTALRAKGFVKQEIQYSILFFLLNTFLMCFLVKKGLVYLGISYICSTLFLLPVLLFCLKRFLNIKIIPVYDFIKMPMLLSCVLGAISSFFWQFISLPKNNLFFFCFFISCFIYSAIYIFSFFHIYKKSNYLTK